MLNNNISNRSANRNWNEKRVSSNYCNYISVETLSLLKFQISFFLIISLVFIHREMIWYADFHTSLIKLILWEVSLSLGTEVVESAIDWRNACALNKCILFSMSSLYRRCSYLWDNFKKIFFDDWTSAFFSNSGIVTGSSL